ncbi:hypothetical protein Tco_1284837, partial [Tanacetum coccineum]
MHIFMLVEKRKYDEIEQKNLLIANDNLIVDYLSKEVFYIATNSELTVSRFTEMHDAYAVVQARCLELKAELFKLHDKFKYQHLKESFVNNKSLPARDAPDFDSVFVIKKMKASIQGKDNAIKKLKMQISQLKETRSEADRTLDLRALDFQITKLTEKVITTALLTENENLKAQLHENMKCITMDLVKPRVLAPGRYAIDVEPIPPHSRNNREVHLDYLKHLKESVETLREIVEEAKVETPLDRSLASKTNVHVIPSTGVNSCTDASGSKPRSKSKKNMISPAKSVNKKKVEEHPRTNNSGLQYTNSVDSSISSKRTVVQIVLWYLDSGCSKHMTRNRSRLKNFVKKFTGIVRFENDNFGAIMGYGDYVIGDNVISRVYYVEGLGHNLFSIGQFCDSDLAIAFRKHSCYVRDVE